MSFDLNELKACFEGVIPSRIATCSADGIPNASYLSHVHLVDSRHVATSYMFFNKTRANLLQNPYSSLHVRDPINLQPYRLQMRYLRSEETGPLFENMSVRLDVIASHEGMVPVFRLKAADVHEVISVEKISDKTDFPSEGLAPVNLDLELTRVISDKLNQARSLEDLFDEALRLLNHYLGWTNLILLLMNDDGRTLTTHASFGYPNGGVGSEVRVGQGLIGLSAEHRKPFQVGALQEGKRYARAAREGVDPSGLSERIPLPGLTSPASQVAVPVAAFGGFFGVLAVESESQSYWSSRDLLFLSLVANQLGAGIASFEGLGIGGRHLGTTPPPAETWRFRFVAGDDFIFVNDQYLIKNTPALILLYVLKTYLKTGRQEFSNLELRAEKSLGLPEIKDNLEARLILLRKRLGEQRVGLCLTSTGRGKFRIDVTGKAELQEG